MSEELTRALAGLLDYVVSHRCKRMPNHYTQAPVMDALKALGRATNISTFGYDYLDVLDQYKEQTRAQRTCQHLPSPQCGDPGPEGAGGRETAIA